MSPTHYCTICGANWRQCDDGSWNLRSEKAGPCCDNAPMGEQIKPLTAQPSAQGEAVATLDHESTWWALAMGAAASLEDAANCMRDEDAKRAALGAAAHVRKQCAFLASAPAAPAQAAITKPAAVLKGYYDFVNEVPKVRVDLTPEGRELPAGTQLWPHPMPPEPKRLPKLPPVPKDMCFGSGIVNGQRVELRGWTTEMMQPWIDAVLAAFKESRR